MTVLNNMQIMQHLNKYLTKNVHQLMKREMEQDLITTQIQLMEVSIYTWNHILSFRKQRINID